MPHYYLRLSKNKKHWEIGEFKAAAAAMWTQKETGRKHGKPIARYPLAQEAEAMAHYQSMIQTPAHTPKPRAIAINRRMHLSIGL